MPSVILTPRAKRDLALIWRDIARDNPYAASDMVSTIESTAVRYAHFPMMGTPRNDWLPGLRSFVQEPYLIVYRPDASGITIIRVLHGARNLNKDMFP